MLGERLRGDLRLFQPLQLEQVHHLVLDPVRVGEATLGQPPLQRRLPKRGFTNPNRVEYQVVNLFQLQRLEETEITPETLAQHGLIGYAKKPVKVLGSGELTRGVTVSAHAFSKSARDKIGAAGGTVQELG